MIETILKIDTPTMRDYSYLPYGEGVYFAKLTKDKGGYGPYYSQWRSSSIRTDLIRIGSVIINNTRYDEKSSLAQCLVDDGSFYWDNDEQAIYIHFVFDVTPESTFVLISAELGGFSLYGNEIFYIDNSKYEPRIDSIPNIKKSVDKFNVGKMKFNDVSIILKNGDGGLDGFILNPVPGSESSIALYDTDTDTELEYYTGIVTSDDSTYEKYGIKLQDKRRRENAKVPTTRFDSTTYPDIESKYVGKVVPEGYGVVNRIQCFPVNGDASPAPTNISFKYATDATTLTSVEVKEDDVWTAVTGSVVNSVPSTGSFDLPYATATNASGAVLECVGTVTLRTEVNPGDVIADMNDRYNSINYDASNYNTTEWTSEAAKLADISLYMAKEKEFFKWIEDLQNGSDLWFLYDIEGDGKRTLRVNDPNRALARAIKYSDIKDDDKSVERDFEELSSTVAVLYNQDYESEVYDRIDVDTYEAQVKNEYQYSEDSEYESLLPASADATIKAQVIAEDRSEARPIVTVKLHGDDLDDLDLKLYDVVTVDLSKPAETYWVTPGDTILADYTGGDTIEADYTGLDSIYAYIGEFKTSKAGRTYWGTIRGQIIGLGYNPTNLDYTLTIRERPESDLI